MRDDLERIVDSLATRIDRAVAVDDTSGRLLVYSSHAGTVDDVRTASILTRHAPDDAWAFAMSFRERIEEGPTRIPGSAALGMTDRVVMVVRCQGAALGFLWLIDPDGDLPDEDIAVAEAAADSIGTVLYRERLLGELELGRERELLRDLLADAADLRQHAASELLEGNIFTPAGPIVAMVIQPVVPLGDDVGEDVRLAIGTVLDQARRMTSPRQRLHLVRPDHGLLVVCTTDRVLPPDGVEALAARLRELLLARLAPMTGAGVDVIIGIGGETHVADAASSYTQALRAVRVAGIVRGYGPVASWDHIGIYRLLTQLPFEQLAAEALHPGVARLLSASGGEQLAATVERYLDLGGDAKATAAALFLHRTSLYYRLRRAEDIAGIALGDGDDRLGVHLGLKLARLSGLYPSAGNPANAAL